MNFSKKVISFITILLVAIATVLGILLLSGSKDFWASIIWGIGVIAMIPSFIYACNGYKKDVAVYYKAFMGLYTLSALITFIADIVNTIAKGTPFVSTIICVVVLINYLILTFAKDFGKQKSMITAFCILGAQLIRFARMLIHYNNDNVIFLSASLNLIVAIVACLFVYAKYQDKTERGAK